jgi:outer membrane protein TolC
MRYGNTIALIGFLVFGLLSTGAAAQEKVYTLEDSIKEALANNWRIKAREQAVDQAEYANKQAKTDFFPKLRTTYSYTRFSEAGIRAVPGTGQIVLAPRNIFRWTGSVRQPLFTGFSLISTYRLSELGIDLSETNLELEKLDLVLRVKEAYFNVLIQDVAVEVLKKQVESLQSTVKVASSFYKVGMIPINDLLKAEVDLGNAEQDLVRVKNQALLARSAFNTVLARPTKEPVDVKDILGYTPERGDLEAYLELALKNRPEIRVVDINILQAEQQIRLAKSQYYPEVVFEYQYSKEGDTLNTSGTPN